VRERHTSQVVNKLSKEPTSKSTQRRLIWRLQQRPQGKPRGVQWRRDRGKEMDSWAKLQVNHVSSNYRQNKMTWQPPSSVNKLSFES